MLTNFRSVLFNKSYFKILYITFLALNMIPVINILKFTRVLLAIFILWGILIIINSLCNYKIKNIKQNHIYLGIIFILVCFVSCIVNFSHTGIRYTSTLVLSLFCFLIFLTFENKEKSDVKSELYKLNSCFALVGTLACFFSILMFVIQYNYSFKNRFGVLIRLGFIENRLFGVFSSPNVGGTFAFLCIVMLGINYFIIKRPQKKYIKILFILSCIINYIYISLSLSRGTIVSIIGSIIILVMFFEIKNSKYNKLNLFFKFIYKLIICCICIGLFYGGILLVRSACKYVPYLTNKIVINNKLNEENVANKNDNKDLVIKFERIETGREDIDISNKRFSIWKASIKLMNKKYLLGIGNTTLINDVEDYIKKGILTYEDYYAISNDQGNPHNGYLKVFTTGGVISLILFLSFLVITAIDGLKKYKNNTEKTFFAFIAAVISYFLINNMIECNFILMGANVFQSIFWIYVGYYIFFCCNNPTINEKGFNVNLINQEELS